MKPQEIEHFKNPSGYQKCANLKSQVLVAVDLCGDSLTLALAVKRGTVTLGSYSAA